MMSTGSTCHSRHTICILVVICLGLFSDANARVRAGESAVVHVRARGCVPASGTLIRSKGHLGIVLTAAHVVGQNRHALVTWISGYSSLGLVLRSDPSVDLTAILVEPPVGADVVPVAQSNDKTGPTNSVILAGFGGGRLRIWKSRVRGIYRNRIRQQSGILISVGKGLSTVGDSGGPMIRDGHLVGVISAGRRAMQGGSIETHGPAAATIRMFCRTAFNG